MADLAPVAADVRSVPTDNSAATTPLLGIAGVDLTQMQPVYLDDTISPPVLRLADAAGNLIRSNAKGVTIGAAKTGQQIAWQQGGVVAPGATLVPAKQYVLSHNSGKIAPIEDLVSGDYVHYLFFSLDTTTAEMNVKSWGRQIP